MFVNPEIALESLPGIEKLDWKSLSPRYARRIQVQSLLTVLVFVVAATAANLLPDVVVMQTWPLWILTAIVAIVLMVRPIIVVPRKGYAVRDKDIIFRSGVVWRSVTAIPFNRIQHVETSSDPIDRKFDLATLQIFTAGGSGGDLKINGLEKDIAEQLRIYILQKVGASIEID
jgi:membrane protein YdbS with pleckstrin-like domain